MARGFDPRQPDRGEAAELIRRIDRAATGKPSILLFVERLRAEGIEAIPSLQASGRLNGMSYRIGQNVYKGSDLARRFTATGLHKLGVDYDPARDREALEALRNAGGRGRPDRNREQVRGRDERSRDRATGLSPDQQALLAHAGMFRVIRTDDARRFLYGGNDAPMRADIAALGKANLIERYTVLHPKTGQPFALLTLTNEGRKATAKQARRDGREQKFYSGLAKPKEIRHDVGIYRMYQLEKARIEAAGGEVTRVVTDYELKARLFRPLNQAGANPKDAALKQRIAAENDVRMVDGRFVIPDLRVEYRDRDGNAARVDLELATGDYNSRQMAGKRAAGLKIYGVRGGHSMAGASSRSRGTGVSAPDSYLGGRVKSLNWISI